MTRLFSSQTSCCMCSLPSAAEALGADATAADVVQLIPPSKRSRAFIHVEGNFAVHVYCTVLVPQKAQEQLQRRLQQIAQLVPGMHATYIVCEATDRGASQEQNVANSTMEIASEYHCSFSRVVAVRRHQIEPLLAALKTQLTGAGGFTLNFDTLKVVINDLRNRTFLALEDVQGMEKVRPMIRQVDASFAHFGLQPFHRDPRPHISLAWWQGDKAAAVESALQQLSKRPDSTGCAVDGAESDSGACMVAADVRCLQCKVGQKVFDVWSN